MPRVAPFSAASAGGWPPTQISVRASRSRAGERFERVGDLLGRRVFAKSARIRAPRASRRDEVPTYIG